MDYFLPFYPTNNPKNQNFEKMKHTIRDIIISHMCTINDSHIYGSSDMECNIQFFCHFGQFFALLPTKQPKILKFWKIGKTAWRYYCFSQLQHKWQSHEVWILECQVCKIKVFPILDHFLHFRPSDNPKNQTFKTNEKNT